MAKPKPEVVDWLEEVFAPLGAIGSVRLFGAWQLRADVPKLRAHWIVNLTTDSRRAGRIRFQLPDSREVRSAIERPRCRRREVWLAVCTARNAARGLVQPLCVERCGHGERRGHREANVHK